jgi:hypothetical protein
MSAVNLIGIENNLLSVLTLNNNLPFIPSAPSGKMYKVAATTYDLAGWKSLTGKDRTTISADPRFIGVITNTIHAPGSPSAPENVAKASLYKQSLHLQSTSQIGTGAVLGAESYFDFDGVTRYLRDNAVDVGAYEYSF